jgi:hypothetical protein
MVRSYCTVYGAAHSSKVELSRPDMLVTSGLFRMKIYQSLLKILPGFLQGFQWILGLSIRN